MTNDEITISDVLADQNKNLCNVYSQDDEDDSLDNEVRIDLTDNLYYTETDFSNFVTQMQFMNSNNLLILSLNIANLISKLSSFKLFLNNITTKSFKPDIISLVETHLTDDSNSGFSNDDLKYIDVLTERER